MTCLVCLFRANVFNPLLRVGLVVLVLCRLLILFLCPARSFLAWPEEDGSERSLPLHVRLAGHRWLFVWRVRLAGHRWLINILMLHVTSPVMRGFLAGHCWITHARKRGRDIAACLDVLARHRWSFHLLRSLDVLARHRWLSHMIGRRGRDIAVGTDLLARHRWLVMLSRDAKRPTPHPHYVQSPGCEAANPASPL